MPEILLCTLNARYIHASLGLRYLLANMRELKPRTGITEFTLEPRAIDMAESLLARNPKIIGFGLYIWNIEQTTKLVKLLKALRPELIIVLGGPEISHEWESQEITAYADHIIPGQADLRFAQLCRDRLGGRGVEKLCHGDNPPLNQISFPYTEYTDEDIANRVIYVEASRGCPYKCEFCLSALDRTAWKFDQDAFLAQMKRLIQRGVKHFKFVDRTFNLEPRASAKILEFFLQQMSHGLFLHFEMIPDHLPDTLKKCLEQYPPGSLQLEIGIQSFNPEVQAMISRRQQSTATQAHIRWLRENTHAHLHTDLIIGLPGESMESFAEGFNRLIAWDVHEIQVGVLKRLRGTPIDRHTRSSGMCYNPNPPYDILSTDRIDFDQMQRLNRFSRYWDLIANSGRFPNTLPLILGDDPFARFLALSDWIFSETAQVHRIALKRLFDLIYRALGKSTPMHSSDIKSALESDYKYNNIKGLPEFLKPHSNTGSDSEISHHNRHGRRQARHSGG